MNTHPQTLKQKQKLMNLDIRAKTIESIESNIVRYVHCNDFDREFTIAYFRTPMMVFAVRVIKHPTDKSNRKIARMYASQKLNNLYNNAMRSEFKNVKLDQDNLVVIADDFFKDVMKNDFVTDNLDRYVSDDKVEKILNEVSILDLKHRYISDILYSIFSLQEYSSDLVELD